MSRYVPKSQHEHLFVLTDAARSGLAKLIASQTDHTMALIGKLSRAEVAAVRALIAPERNVLAGPLSYGYRPPE